MKKVLLFLAIFVSVLSCTKEEGPKKEEENNDSIPNTNVTSNIKFNSSLTYGTMTDQQGNVYKTIIIGNKTWMAENLRTKKFQNGDDIPTTDPFNKDITYTVSPTYQWAYNGDENNVVNYGRLYSGYVITDSRNVCPTGWHVSSFEDWDDLINVFEGVNLIQKRNVGADHIREIETIHWKRVITDVTNSTGFTALPAGARVNDGEFVDLGEFGAWWKISSDGICKKEAVSDGSPTIMETAIDMTTAYSIRCVKD